MTETRRIMCFGDSLTWGWIPVAEGAPTLRYPFAERWTGAMAAQLGAGFEIVEEGLSARVRAWMRSSAVQEPAAYGEFLDT